ncbi:PilX N-terminal domain-containing pilus assembly protein [Noviherbaspirillum denitrificans]|uniref:Uncharacterized protein n=1 Tax=Noviherbaspirillum denitrificans TaxID=1968433 RepID=A0A254TH58_9BURK|nr:PilX N-terminal domain-containing pilus assembly protein [Noviherbaspirillum denitrificans]OWW21865.1 hypothetical protein AYR66_22580 [Noviherbaspirillum denitrificans]
MKPRQQGATLVVGLIMLALITLTVTTALTLSSTNLKSVGNMQVRNEAIAAANNAIEQVISGPFAVTPASSQIQIDIDNDNTVDYIVNVSVPTCLYNISETTSNGTGFYTDVETPGFEAAPPTFNTLWDITAVVSDARSNTTIVTVHQGVRRSQLPQLQTSASCPGPTT